MEGYRTVRTSIILVATGGRTKVYPSLDDVPAALRDRLVESTTGEDATTLLIADRKGRAAILQSLRRKRRQQQPSAPPVPAPGRAIPGWLRTWGAIALPGAVGLALWLLATYH